MSTLSRRDRLTQRSLDRIYRHFGRPCHLILPTGQEISNQLAKLDIREQEQNVDGSRIEVDMKGFTARFRRHTFPDNILETTRGILPIGTIITFDPPVLGYTYYHIDAKPMAFNRDGGQIIAQLTPTSSPATVTIASGAAAPPAGLPLG